LGGLSLAQLNADGMNKRGHHGVALPSHNSRAQPNGKNLCRRWRRRRHATRCRKSKDSTLKWTKSFLLPFSNPPQLIPPDRQIHTKNQTLISALGKVALDFVINFCLLLVKPFFTFHDLRFTIYARRCHDARPPQIIRFR
jgi:hypothetical protein